MGSRQNSDQEQPKRRSRPRSLDGWEDTAIGTGPQRGVAADLWTRALALEDKARHRRVLVSTDIHIFTREQHREIVATVRKRHGLEERDVMLIATHTHSGPALPRGFDPGISWGLNEGEMRKLYAASDRVRDQTLNAIARALSDLQPARLSFGRGKAAFGVNRRVPKDDGSYDFGANPARVSDPDMPVLLVESTKGCLPMPGTAPQFETGKRAFMNITRTTRAWRLTRSSAGSRARPPFTRPKCRVTFPRSEF
jgi:hypothetical protein